MLSVQGSELLMMCQRDANQFQLAQCSIMIIIIIIIIEICKAPTLRLKALNKHTHIEMENLIKKEEKRRRYRQGFLNTMSEMHTHTHTHTHTPEENLLDCP